MTINWRTVLVSVETTVLSAVTGFLAAITASGGGTFDANHIGSAALAAGIGLAYRLSAVLENAISSAPTPSDTPKGSPQTLP